MKPIYKGSLAEDLIGEDALEHLKWILNLSPGDLYYACDGFNHVLKKMECHYVSVALINGKVNYTFNISEETLNQYDNWFIDGILLVGEDDSRYYSNCCVGEPILVENMPPDYQLYCDSRGVKRDP